MCINAFICIKKCKQEYMYAYALWQDTRDTDSGVAIHSLLWTPEMVPVLCSNDHAARIPLHLEDFSTLMRASVG